MNNLNKMFKESSSKENNHDGFSDPDWSMFDVNTTHMKTSGPSSPNIIVAVESFNNNENDNNNTNNSFNVSFNMLQPSSADLLALSSSSSINIQNNSRSETATTSTVGLIDSGDLLSLDEDLSFLIETACEDQESDGVLGPDNIHNQSMAVGNETALTSSASLNNEINFSSHDHHQTLVQESELIKNIGPTILDTSAEYLSSLEPIQLDINFKFNSPNESFF